MTLEGLQREQACQMVLGEIKKTLHFEVPFL
jgi:hypothetical protein